MKPYDPYLCGRRSSVREVVEAWAFRLALGLAGALVVTGIVLLQRGG